jgi:hypothetical protein
MSNQQERVLAAIDNELAEKFDAIAALFGAEAVADEDADEFMQNVDNLLEAWVEGSIDPAEYGLSDEAQKLLGEYSEIWTRREALIADLAAIEVRQAEAKRATKSAQGQFLF